MSHHGPVTDLTLLDVNVLVQSGGAIAVKTRGRLIQCLHCLFTDNQAEEDGGAVDLTGGHFSTCSACQFMNNQAKRSGGALDLTSGGQMDSCLSCQFERNAANSVRNQHGPVTPHYQYMSHHGPVTNLTLLDVNVLVQWGGAIAVRARGRLIQCLHCNFEKNTAKRGAAMFVHEGTSDMCTQCQFKSNTANVDGGVLFCQQYGKAYCTDCSFDDNQAGISDVLGRGGVLRIRYGAFWSCSNCTIANSKSISEGGALYAELGGHVHLSMCRFRHNQAVSFGATNYKEGIAIYASASLVECTDCEFYSDQDRQEGGGGKQATTVHLNGAKLLLTGRTVFASTQDGMALKAESLSSSVEFKKANVLLRSVPSSKNDAAVLKLAGAFKIEQSIVHLEETGRLQIMSDSEVAWKASRFTGTALNMQDHMCKNMYVQVQEASSSIWVSPLAKYLHAPLLHR